jgi:hypothetical protein
MDAAVPWKSHVFWIHWIIYSHLFSLCTVHDYGIGRAAACVAIGQVHWFVWVPQHRHQCMDAAPLPPCEAHTCFGLCDTASIQWHAI